MIWSGRNLNWFVFVGALVGLVSLCAARSAGAATNPTTCVNDIDCVATPQCGGDVCDYTVQPPVCKPAGSQPKGSDGWCTTDDQCKCQAQGATCVGLICTFTRPCDAPDAGPCTSGTDAGGGGGGG